MLQLRNHILHSLHDQNARSTTLWLSHAAVFLEQRFFFERSQAAVTPDCQMLEPLVKTLLKRNSELSHSDNWRVKAAKTLTAEKTSLENKHLRKGAYFAISASCSHSIILTKYASK